MKKTIYSIFALSLAFFSSCTEDMFESRFQTSGNEITFALEELGTRATPIEDSEALFDAFDSFDVVAYNGGTKVFEDVLDENMVAQDKHYWPETPTDYDFFVMPQPTDTYKFSLSLSLDDDSSDDSYKFTDGSYRFNYQAPTPDGETDGVAAADLVMAHAQANRGQVGLTFEHLLAGVRFVYANPLVAHHVKYVGVQNATMNGQIVYSEGKFNWTSQDGDANLYQAVNADIMKVNSQIHDDDAHFMLIPGGNDNDNVTFSVIMDNNQAYNLEYKKSDLKAGEILTINIGDPASEQEAVPGIGATKEYVKNSDGSYTLRIETYVTGKQEIVVSSAPADIAVLVDVSRSMTWGMDFDYEEQDRKTYSGEWNLFPQGESNDDALYFLDNDGNYYEVKMFDVAGGFLYLDRHFWMYYEKEGVRYYLIGDKQEGIPAKDYATPTYNSYPEDINGSKIEPAAALNAKIWTGVLYKKVSNSNKTTRLEATKAALNQFVDNVYADGKKNDVIHKISIVRFSGSATVVKDWIELKDDANVTELKNAINGINASGATQADLGMTSVKNQFSKDAVKNDDASKVVVMLTDGDPTSGSSFSSSVANSAIATSKDLKTNTKATVWSVYVGDTPSAQSYDYMQRVSSNSTDATTYQNGNVEDKGYYVYAGDSEALKNVFSTISSTSGGATKTMNENTVLSDVISPVFDLSGVGVDKMNIYYIEQGSDNPIPAGDEIKPNLTNSTITVQGFDYSKYFWGDHTDGIKGRKLVIELTLKPKADLPSGTYVTNGAGSGLYVGGTLVSPFTNATEGKDPTDPNTIVIPTKK